MIPILRFYDPNQDEIEAGCNLCGEPTVQVLEIGRHQSTNNIRLCLAHLEELAGEARQA